MRPDNPLTIDSDSESEKRKQQEFFELASRLRNESDPLEVESLGDQLGRVVFAPRANRGGI